MIEEKFYFWFVYSERFKDGNDFDLDRVFG